MMSAWTRLLRIPDDMSRLDHAEAWFATVAERLLNGTEFLVAGRTYRFLEVEFYLYRPDHLDPFTHREAIQLQCGRWYFHRTHGFYRGGSYKGIDMTFGDGSASGGMLFRSMAAPDGTVIDGPSLCVDHLLAVTGATSVAELDGRIAGRRAWEADNPLSLRMTALENREILHTPRVGMSLRAKTSGLAERFVMAPYRFLSEPRRIGKGKPHMVLALHARGDDLETIYRLTGCPRAAIRRYVEEYEMGRKEGDFAPYLGTQFGLRGWCRLYGVWRRKFPPIPS